MAMSLTEIETMIREAFPDARVEVKDLAGDGNHYAATVVSAAFKGKTRVRQHQMVYAGAEGPDGRRAARAGADHVGELTRRRPDRSAAKLRDAHISKADEQSSRTAAAAAASTSMAGPSASGGSHNDRRRAADGRAGRLIQAAEFAGQQRQKQRIS